MDDEYVIDKNELPTIKTISGLMLNEINRKYGFILFYMNVIHSDITRLGDNLFKSQIVFKSKYPIFNDLVFDIIAYVDFNTNQCKVKILDERII